MANKFWNDHNLETQRKAWHWFLAIAIGVFLGIYAASCGEDNAPELSAQQPEGSLGTRPVPPIVGMTGPNSGELHFYQNNPPCPDAQAIYLLLPGKLYTEEHHRVYMCGYHR